MVVREQRGKELADRLRIVREDGRPHLWLVPSETGKGRYTVDLAGENPRCTCPDYELRRDKCKHIFAVEFTVISETKRVEAKAEEGNRTLTTVKKTTRITKVTYPQNWPAYNAAQTSEKAMFQILLRDLCRVVPEIPYVFGPRRLPYGDMIFCAAFKVYSLFSGRRFISDLTDAHAKGYIGKVPHFNTIFNTLEREDLTEILKELIMRTSLPLKAVESAFAVDASGFSTCRFVRWFNERYGHEQTNRDWIKVHLMCGVKTNIVTSVEITGRYEHDGLYFAPLVNHTALHFDMNEISADKGYSSKANLRVAQQRGATPYIAFKTNAKAQTQPDDPGDDLTDDSRLWDNVWHFYNLNRPAFLEHYHKRSNVESTFSMIKAKFGDALKSKTDTAMTNELLCKVLCHNICVLIMSMHELGIEPMLGPD